MENDPERVYEGRSLLGEDGEWHWFPTWLVEKSIRQKKYRRKVWFIRLLLDIGLTVRLGTIEYRKIQKD